ncbi:Mrp/NBP35 family ATP-binding protein [Natronomonas sp.]|uniref:Mrp/NBP35 family ATP-binding protein n=1 Tax=Natronomonas sp. TaxID=2184060 RepID=UPI002FC39E5F
MTPTDSPADGTEARLERVLGDADIGGDVLSADLGDLGALEVSLDGSEATVTVTLPIPSAEVRTAIEREVAESLSELEGVTALECRFEPDPPDDGERVDFIPAVKNVIAVASGKGGVGKSTIAANLAVALADAGADVGLLDADVYGPNAPTMLGLGDRTPDATPEDEMLPREAHGVKVMSMEFIVGEDDPVIWRGPLVDEFVKQLFGDVKWGMLDYLIVDLPPGTGDAQLSLVQHLPVTGAVIVTTPQPVARDDARRSLEGITRYDIPVLGIAENMAGFECHACGSEHAIFDEGGAEQLATEFDVPVLGKIPIDPEIGASQADTDQPEPPGVSIPGIGRLQLPRTRAERERLTTRKPMVAREEGDSRRAFEVLATRTAARINDFVVTKENGKRGEQDRT